MNSWVKRLKVIAMRQLIVSGNQATTYIMWNHRRMLPKCNMNPAPDMKYVEAIVCSLSCMLLLLDNPQQILSILGDILVNFPLNCETNSNI